MSDVKGLPHLRDLRGIAPDALPQGMSSEEFVRLLREGRDPWNPADRVIRIGPAHAPVVLDGVTVEELAKAYMAAQLDWTMEEVEEAWRAKPGVARDSRFDGIRAVLAAIGIAIPEGYGIVTPHGDAFAIVTDVKVRNTHGVAFLPPRKEDK